MDFNGDNDNDNEPFVWDGRARFLVLRQVDRVERHLERIGNLVLKIEEWAMGKYKS